MVDAKRATYAYIHLRDVGAARRDHPSRDTGLLGCCSGCFWGERLQPWKRESRAHAWSKPLPTSKLLVEVAQRKDNQRQADDRDGLQQQSLPPEHPISLRCEDAESKTSVAVKAGVIGLSSPGVVVSDSNFLPSAASTTPPPAPGLPVVDPNGCRCGEDFFGCMVKCRSCNRNL